MCGIIRKIKREDGFALVLVAGVIAVFLLLLGFGLDMGRTWLYSGGLQNAIDAAALAGAAAAYVRMEVDGLGNVYSQELLLDPFVAETESKNVFYANAARLNLDDKKSTQLESVEVKVDQNRVTVTAKMRVKMYLLQLAGYQYMTITKSSTAECILSN
ncbi:hypothetical protein AN618_23540 [Fervidicola ferrireducens]|uniref:Putative Flp pilus-assembly TadG-like N-terminal domain-containing protein n=1 Tax=Fervidicola ferrireducens TaxID=520764 RepID=A0A140L183_9FIRM|nr:pilus assembly protein TadG-related protein [Fervidicola ferrireducens]KXG74308.1 hypothetical protein AN618_23540 [Fervidicola ferrireducens]